MLVLAGNAGVRPVMSIADAYRMRAVRNEVREFLTGNHFEIGVLEQLRWYLRYRNDTSLRAFLFFDGAGYGLMRKEPNLPERPRTWLTGALRSGSRGKGHGRAIFEFMTELAEVDSEAWLQVWHWNDRAIRLYESLGYVEVETKSGIITMRRVP